MITSRLSDSVEAKTSVIIKYQHSIMNYRTKRSWLLDDTILCQVCRDSEGKYEMPHVQHISSEYFNEMLKNEPILPVLTIGSDTHLKKSHSELLNRYIDFEAAIYAITVVVIMMMLYQWVTLLMLLIKRRKNSANVSSVTKLVSKCTSVIDYSISVTEEFELRMMELRLRNGSFHESDADVSMVNPSLYSNNPVVFTALLAETNVHKIVMEDPEYYYSDSPVEHTYSAMNRSSKTVLVVPPLGDGENNSYGSDDNDRSPTRQRCWDDEMAAYFSDNDSSACSRADEGPSSGSTLGALLSEDSKDIPVTTIDCAHVGSSDSISPQDITEDVAACHRLEDWLDKDVLPLMKRKLNVEIDKTIIHGTDMHKKSTARSPLTRNRKLVYSNTTLKHRQDHVQSVANICCDAEFSEKSVIAVATENKEIGVVVVVDDDDDDDDDNNNNNNDDDNSHEVEVANIDDDDDDGLSVITMDSGLIDRNAQRLSSQTMCASPTVDSQQLKYMNTSPVGFEEQLFIIFSRTERLFAAVKVVERRELEMQYEREQRLDADGIDVFDVHAEYSDLLCSATLDCLTALREDCAMLVDAVDTTIRESNVNRNADDNEECESEDEKNPQDLSTVQAMELELRTLNTMFSDLCPNRTTLLPTFQPSPVRRSLALELLAVDEYHASTATTSDESTQIAVWSDEHVVQWSPSKRGPGGPSLRGNKHDAQQFGGNASYPAVCCSSDSSPTESSVVCCTSPARRGIKLQSPQSGRILLSGNTPMVETSEAVNSS